jgi:hypothetical protein
MWQLRVDVWDDDGEVGSDYKYVNVADDGGGCAPPISQPIAVGNVDRFWIAGAPPESRSKGIRNDPGPLEPDTITVMRVC